MEYLHMMGAAYTTFGGVRGLGSGVRQERKQYAALGHDVVGWSVSCPPACPVLCWLWRGALIQGSALSRACGCASCRARAGTCRAQKPRADVKRSTGGCEPRAATAKSTRNAGTPRRSYMYRTSFVGASYSTPEYCNTVRPENGERRTPRARCVSTSLFGQNPTRF
jgi:hypothetical protein